MRFHDPVSCLILFVLLCAPGLAVAAADFKVDLDAATCQFSGGTDGAGNVEVNAGSGNKKIQVKLQNGGDYTIEPVTFSGAGADQMSATAGGNARVVNIFNRNSGPADVKYSISLRNSNTGEVSDCDPRIINR